MGPLLEESSVVDDPSRHRLLLSQLLADIASGFKPHRLIAPVAVPNEVKQFVVHLLGKHRIGARERRNGLDALARGISENTEGIDGERFPLPTVLQVGTQSTQILLESGRGGCVQILGHTALSHETWP